MNMRFAARAALAGALAAACLLAGEPAFGQVGEQAPARLEVPGAADDDDVPTRVAGRIDPIVADPAAMHAVRLRPDEHLVLDGTLSHPAWRRAPVYDRFVE